MVETILIPEAPGEGTTVPLGRQGLFSEQCPHPLWQGLGVFCARGVGISKSWWTLTCPVGDPRRTRGECLACCWLAPPR